MSTSTPSNQPSLVTTIRSKLNTAVWTMFFCLCAAIYAQTHGVIDIRVLTAEDNSRDARIREAQTELAQDIFEPEQRHHKRGGR